jgi:hypothetical protein
MCQPTPKSALSPTPPVLAHSLSQPLLVVPGKHRSCDLAAILPPRHQGSSAWLRLQPRIDRERSCCSVASFNHASAAARILNVDQFPDTVTLAWFEQHHVCKRCGSTASVCSKNAVYNPAYWCSPNAPFVRLKMLTAEGP